MAAPEVCLADSPNHHLIEHASSFNQRVNCKGKASPSKLANHLTFVGSQVSKTGLPSLKLFGWVVLWIETSVLYKSRITAQPPSKQDLEDKAACIWY
jgi:hypothetical protein